MPSSSISWVVASGHQAIHHEVKRKSVTNSKQNPSLCVSHPNLTVTRNYKTLQKRNDSWLSLIELETVFKNRVTGPGQW